MSFIKQEDGDLVGGVSFMRGRFQLHGKRCCGPAEGRNTSLFSPNRPPLSWWGPLMEFSSSWPIPTLDLGRHEGGSANLAAARWVWQTRDFQRLVFNQN